MEATIVDSEAAVVALLDSLDNLPTEPPSLYLDIEGVHLSRHGSISILQLFILPQKHIYLVDVFVLKEAAFDTSNRSGTKLRSILESAQVPKVFFDVRNDSDALFAHFQISMRGVQDVQLLEVATRSLSRERVNGLAKCIAKDARLTPEASAVWKVIKENGQSLFAPECGGSYEVFNSRPMLRDIVDYCTQDVVYLPVLWEVYNQRISPKWMKMVQNEVCERILASQKASYEPHGMHKTLSPWAKAAKSERGKGPGPGEARNQKKKSVIPVAQTAAMEAPKTMVGTQPDSQAAGLQRSAKSVALVAAKTAPKLIAELERPLPKLDLAIRSKDKLELVSDKKTNSNLFPATVHQKWTCTTCGREMQESQKEEHIAGKQHIARAKQTAPPQTETAKHKASVAAKNRRPEPLATGATSRATNPERAEVANTKARKRQAAVPRSQQQQQKGLSYPPDHLFLGFQERAAPMNHRYETSWPLDNVDYSICDKDCGWCGHCMNGVDVF